MIPPPSSPDEPLDLPFAGWEGRGIRVAVIDSGIHVRHPHISSVAGGISVGPDGAIEQDSYMDRLGHGTAVMAAIQEKAPLAEYFAVQVFHQSLRASARALLRAIEWSIEQRMQIVNLSLGTGNDDHAEPFSQMVQRALAAGVILVSAREMNGVCCFPGCLPGVLGVSIDETCDRNSYRVAQTESGVAFLASGYPRPAPGIRKERNLQGISFAVANMSGFVARALQGLEDRSFGNLQAALIGHADTSLNSHIATEP
jgi:subtilisin family serine protease